jgi:endonuclease YncB( thermonuclease family)
MRAWLHIGTRTTWGFGLALACALGAAAPAARFDAAVVKVVDGDSLWLRPAGADKAVEVRIQDIDAPEICQPWGRQAREALAERVAGRTLVVQPRGRDTHGRLLALISIGGENLGAWMVGEGHAWSIRTRWDRGPLVKEERMASALRRGLWIEPNPVEPRAFRRQHGPCVAGETGVPSAAPTSAHRL